MKLEHLMQAYNYNNIQAVIDTEVNENGERAGVIKFGNEINASYLLDKEDIVVVLHIYFNCLSKERSLEGQIDYTTKVIKVIQNTIELLGNVPQLEANMIMKKLGLFDRTFKEEKQIKHINHSYKIKIINGLLLFSVSET